MLRQLQDQVHDLILISFWGHTYPLLAFYEPENILMLQILHCFDLTQYKFLDIGPDIWIDDFDGVSVLSLHIDSKIDLAWGPDSKLPEDPILAVQNSLVQIFLAGVACWGLNRACVALGSVQLRVLAL